MEKISHKLIFVSDIHLLDPDGEIALALLGLIQRLDTSRVEYFVLGGDIFDFCFGASLYFKVKFDEIGQALEVLAQQGVKVIFMQGNHEFSMERIGWEGVDFVTGLDRKFTLSCGASFAVTHGDRFFMNKSYKAYIAVTRSKIFRSLALLVPQTQLDRFALYCSRLSREKGSERKLVHKQVLSQGKKWLKNNGSQYGLFGHFHHPYQESFGEKMLLSVKSWHRPNFLAYDEGKFLRYSLENLGGQQRWVETEN